MIAAARKLGGVTVGDAVWLIHLALTAIPIWFTVDLMFWHPLAVSSPGMSWWAAHGTEVFWSRCCATVAIIGLIGLVSRNLNVRLASATGLGVAHAIIATGFHLGNPVGTATGTYLIIAALAAARIWLERNAA